MNVKLIVNFIIKSFHRFDERSLYFEQKFVSLHDNFIRAIALCKNTAVNCDVIGAMRDRFDMAQPVCPEDLAKFIESNDISSNKLKMSGHQVETIFIGKFTIKLECFVLQYFSVLENTLALGRFVTANEICS